MINTSCINSIESLKMSKNGAFNVSNVSKCFHNAQIETLSILVFEISK